jgi:hypothetical protein
LCCFYPFREGHVLRHLILEGFLEQFDHGVT